MSGTTERLRPATVAGAIAVAVLTVLHAAPPAVSSALGDVTNDEFPVPTADSVPWGITAGPDGNLWFIERRARTIGRITPAGAVTEFAFPPPRGAPGELGARRPSSPGPTATCGSPPTTSVRLTSAG